MSTYAEIVSVYLNSYGLNPWRPVEGQSFSFGKLVHSWQCVECQKWAAAYRAHGLTIDGDLVHRDAKTAEVNSDGLCSRCAVDGPEFREYVQTHGEDDEARDIANYTPEKMVGAFLMMDRSKKHGIVEA